MDNLADATVFITGGAQGIGLGIARAFARAGARIALADVDLDQLRAAEQELSILGKVSTHTLDVRDRDAFARVADAVEERFGPVTVLCNNAGVAAATPPSALTYQLWDHVLGVNLGGTVNGLQTFLPRMLSRGGPAHILNVASGAGLVASDKVLYVASKFAVVGLSESLRQHRELTERGIGVTVACPGFVRTNVMANSAKLDPGGALPANEARDALFERFGLPPDVAGEQIVQAIRENRPYVHTDRMLAGLIEQRARVLLETMPPETERDRQIAAAFEDAIKSAILSG